METSRSTSRDTQANAIRFLQDSRRILMLTHENPDVDGASAMAALALALAQGRQVIACVNGAVPALVEALAPADTFATEIPHGFAPDAVIVLDTDSIPRLGDANAGLLQHGGGAPIVINVDHHLTNTRFGTVNVVLPGASSTSEIVSRLLEAARIAKTPAVASLLLMGILADTGRFRYAYTSARTLEVSARLMRAGAELFRLNEQAEKVLTFEGIRLWGDVVMRAHQLLAGKVIWSDVTLPMVEHTPNAELVIGSELFNFFLRSKDCHLVVLFAERPDGQVQLHLRSSARVDSTVIARHFGGGGHARAAGSHLPGPLANAESRVLEFVESNLRKIYAKQA